MLAGTAEAGLDVYVMKPGVSRHEAVPGRSPKRTQFMDEIPAGKQYLSI